jgi:integrase
MTRIKLAYIHRFTDRLGKVRHYFRRPGYKQVALPGLPGSEEFMRAYQAGLENSPIEIGASRTVPGTVNAAIVGYYGSTQFHELRPVTQENYRRILESFRAKHGDKRIALLERKHIKMLLDERAEKPEAARNLLRTLRVLLNHAAEVGMRVDNPALGIRLGRRKGDGYHTWTEQEIAQFEAHHPVGSKARLALALGVYSGQRRTDVVALGRQHVRDGVLYLTQSKTGTQLAIPVHPELAAIIDATPIPITNTFLMTSYGRPFTSHGFGAWFRARCDEAGLPPACAFHGLRKAACRRLAEAGASANVIAAISGHRSLSQVEHYTKQADQARLARTGVNLLKGESRTSSGKLD